MKWGNRTPQTATDPKFRPAELYTAPQMGKSLLALDVAAATATDDSFWPNRKAAVQGSWQHVAERELVDERLLDKGFARGLGKFARYRTRLERHSRNSAYVINSASFRGNRREILSGAGVLVG